MKKPRKPHDSAPPTPRGGKNADRTSSENQAARSVSADASPVQDSFSAPEHLRADTRQWWRTVADEYALESHHLRLLTLAAEAWDRGVEAREAIARHGTVYVDRFDQPRARPEVAIERDSRIAFARLVRELALDLDPPDEAGRPPRIGIATEKRPPAATWDEDDRRILGLD
jgi:phage terminase small subunit